MDSKYNKIFGGNPMMAKRIKDKLQELGIEAISKDTLESERIAGVVPSPHSDIEIYVHIDEMEKALKVINELT